MADNPEVLLTGTSTCELELAVYNAGNAKISYEVREFIPKTVFGDTSIEYPYTTPSGWTRSADGSYFSKKVTLNDNATVMSGKLVLQIEQKATDVPTVPVSVSGLGSTTLLPLIRS